MDGVTLDYEDKKSVRPLPKGTVKKMLKEGHKERVKINREERTLGSMSFGGLIWYIGWHRLFWPHRTFFGWFLFIASNAAWFWFK